MHGLHWDCNDALALCALQAQPIPAFPAQACCMLGWSNGNGRKCVHFDFMRSLRARAVTTHQADVGLELHVPSPACCGLRDAPLSSEPPPPAALPPPPPLPGGVARYRYISPAHPHHGGQLGAGPWGRARCAHRASKIALGCSGMLMNIPLVLGSKAAVGQRAHTHHARAPHTRVHARTHVCVRMHARMIHCVHMHTHTHMLVFSTRAHI